MDKPIKVSIIMPVYNVARYLRKCLDSVVTQSLQDIEIIAVNDGSTDDCMNILEEYQSKYPCLLKVYSTENRGVSHARNYGMEKAVGEYIQFVDSDDFIEKDMCEKLYNKAIKDQNDLVICGRFNFFENEQTGQMKKELVGTDLINRNFVLSENRYELAHILPFPWDKLFKRELLTGMKFPENMRFEDLVFVYQVVCKAKYIGVVEEQLYNYRKTTQGGFLNTFSKQTLDIIKAFELVFDYMEENQYMDLYHYELEFICTRHFLYRYITLFKEENRGKGKLAIKLEIINKTQEFLNSRLPNWRNNHYLKYSSGWLKKRLPLFTNHKKMLLLTKLREYMPNKLYNLIKRFKNFDKKWSTRFKKLKRSKSKKAFIMRKLPILKIFTQKGTVYYTGLYEKLPIAECDILLESKHGEDVAGNIFALLRELSKDTFEDYRVMLAIEQQYRAKYSALLARYEINNVIMLEIYSKEYMKALATAKYLVTDTSFPPYFIKKKEQIYLNTWHGTPLKAMGRIVPNREYALGNIQRNFLIADYLLYQNDFSKEVFLRDYMLKGIYPGTVLVSGYPRNSVFFHKNRYQQIRKECLMENKQVIVYMPTWRGLLHQKETAKQLEQLTGYFMDIDSKLTDSQVFFVKLHPYVKEGMDLSYYKHIKEFPEEYETYDFLNSSDVLVTDYSSIMFDYGVTKRKMILFTYDREEYLSDRGVYLNLEDLELPKADTVDQLIAEINGELKPYPKFFDQFCSYDSINTPKQIIDTLIYGKDGEQEHFKTVKYQDNGRNKIFIFTKGMKRDNYTQRMIESINAIDLEKNDVYVCMKVGDVKNATQMLSLLKPEVNYFPITYEINYTRSDYILSKLQLKFGVNIGFVKQRNDKIMAREIRKYFGDASFDVSIHHSERDRMVGHLCCLLSDKRIYNFKYFSYKEFKARRAYRKQVKYFIRRFPEYTLVVATKEVDSLNKRFDNIYYNEDNEFPMSKIIGEVTQHEGRSHHIS